MDMPALRRVLDALRQRGLLLQFDNTLASITGLVTGETIRGSWWGHPRAHEIHAVARSLRAHDDVLIAKLVASKLTYVHRQLWASLLAVARSGEPWQQRGLSRDARSLLHRIERYRMVRTEDLTTAHWRSPEAVGPGGSRARGPPPGPERGGAHAPGRAREGLGNLGPLARPPRHRDRAHVGECRARAARTSRPLARRHQTAGETPPLAVISHGGSPLTTRRRRQVAQRMQMTSAPVASWVIGP